MRSSILAFCIAAAVSSAALAAGQTSTNPSTGAAATAPGTSGDTGTSSKMGGSMHGYGSNAASNQPLSTETFVQRAAQDGMAEVALGKLALDKSKNEDVRSFAQKMVTDHTQANNELKDLAKKKNLDVPKDTDQRHEKVIAELKKKSAADFDSAFAQHMATAHDRAVSLFRSASTSSSIDPDLRAFATKTLTTLEQHDRLAAQLNANVGSGTASTDHTH